MIPSAKRKNHPDIKTADSPQSNKKPKRRTIRKSQRKRGRRKSRRAHSYTALRAEMSRKDQLITSLADLVLAALLVLSFSGMGFALLGIAVDLPLMLIAILTSLACLSIYSFLKWPFKLLILLLAPFLLWLRAPTWDAFRLFVFGWINRFAALLEANTYRGYFPQLTDIEYASMRAETLNYFVFLLIFLISLYAYFISCRYKFANLSLISLILSSTACLFFDRDYGAIWVIWGFIALVPLYFISANKRYDIKPEEFRAQYLRALTAGLISASLLFAPAYLLANEIDIMSIYSRSAQGVIDDVSTILPDEFRRPRAFQPFSINRSGYYPDANQLGGTVRLNPNPVLHLRGQASGLLRGQTSQIYTGYSWERIRPELSWRYGSGLYADERAEAFSVDDSLFEPLGLDQTAIRQADYAITHLQGSIPVLFTDGYASSLTYNEDSQRLAFFNEDAVLYAQYPLDSGQGYTVSSQAHSFTTLISAVRELYASSREIIDGLQRTDAGSPFAPPSSGDFTHYLQLPDRVEYEAGGSVYENSFLIASGAIESQWDPYPGAQDILTQLDRLQRYLQSMNYSLTVENVPEGQDFVEHLLMTEIGYCVYYATALTVMARVIGIPARYVEGFGIPSTASTALSSSGITITGEYAHAWTEVYIEGLGWITMDPTPGGVAGSIDNQGIGAIPISPSPLPSIPAENISPLPAEPSPMVPGENNNLDSTKPFYLNSSFILTLIVLLICLLILAVTGQGKKLSEKLLLLHPILALRFIAQNKQSPDGRWSVDHPDALRYLYLLYWNQIRKELHRLAFARDRHDRRFKRREARRIRKHGPDFKEADHDFYQAKIQSIYTPSPFVQYLIQEANKRRAESEAREQAEVEARHAREKHTSRSRFKRWFDPSLIGSWRQELKTALDDLALDKLDLDKIVTSEEQHSRNAATAGLALQAALIESERLAERAAFAGPDYQMDPESIHHIHRLIKQLRKLRRHWPREKPKT